MAALNPWRNKAIHWFYVFVEHGLYPDLVKKFYYYVNELGCRMVVDPFIGGGVVGVEGVVRGFNVIGVDSNPWALIVSQAKTTSIDNRGLIKQFIEHYNSIDEALIPSPRLYRYHDQVIVEKLGRIRAVIEKLDNKYKPLLLTLFGKLVDEYSLLLRSPAPRFGGKPRRDNPLHRYLGFLEKALEELRNTVFRGRFIPVLGDSTIWLPDKICGLLTSPPFANNIDYIRHTQLQLLWIGLARNSSDLGYLRDLQIPACQAASRRWKKEARDKLLDKLVNNMNPIYRKRYSKFLKQYLYYMDQHFKLLSEKLDGIAWYTIGDSFLGGIYIPVHEILAKRIKDNGLKIKIKRLSKRYSRGRELGLYLLMIESKR